MVYEEVKMYKLKRIYKGIKLKDVARAVGVTSGYISRFEREKDLLMADEKIQAYKEFIDNYDNVS